MREVHANDIKTSLTQDVDLLHRVRLGPDGADDGGATVSFGGAVFGVERGGPFQLRAVVEVIQRACHRSGSCICKLEIDVKNRNAGRTL